MAYLYLGPDGTPKTRHSYSAGCDLDESPHKYYLKRVCGWRERGQKSYFEFGKVFEAAIRFYHENNMSGGQEEFSRLWEKFADVKMHYAKADKDWKHLNQLGQEMLEEYEQKLPDLPIPEKPIFQAETLKEMFPGTTLGGISQVGYLDMICGDRIVDIKTWAKALPEIPNLAAHDPQLKQYSFLTGKRDVAFIGFAKTKKKGERLQFLPGRVSDADAAEAGQIIGQQIQEICMYRERNWWPKRGWGVRFPNDHSKDVYFRAFVLGDPAAMDELEKSDQDWLDQLEME